MAGNIAQYNNPIDGLKTSDQATDTIARMGRFEKENLDSAGIAYEGAAKDVGGALENQQFLGEVSKGSAGLAIMNANLSAQWNKLSQSTDPNDTSIQQKFMDGVSDQINQWQDGFETKRGQDYALNAGDQMRNHLWEHTSADMSNRAGIAAINNVKTSLQGWSSTAYQDPTTMSHALSQIDTALAAHKEAAAGILGQGQADQLDTLGADMKNEVVKAGIKGIADGKNPQQAINALNSDTFKNYLSDEEISQLKNYTVTQIHGRNLDQQNEARAQEQKVYLESEKANVDYMGKLTQGQLPSAASIIADTHLTTQQKSLWVANDGILSMPQDKLQSASLGDNFTQNAQAVYSGRSMSPDAMLNAVKQGQISPAGAIQIQKLQAMQKTPEGMAELVAQKSTLASVQSQLVKGGPYASDPVGQKQYNAFMNTFYTSWDAAIKKGASPAELSDPTSKSYIGNLATQFKRSDAQIIADVTRGNQ